MKVKSKKLKNDLDQQIDTGMEICERRAQISKLCITAINHTLEITKHNAAIVETLKKYLERELSPDTPQVYERRTFMKITVNIANYALMCAGPSTPLITALNTMTKLLPDQA